MRLSRARVQQYRSIRDTGWFEVEETKTILVGPNEAGKTVLLRALEQLSPSTGTPGFDSLRDYPRSELNDLDTGQVKAEDVTVPEGEFKLDDDDAAAVHAISPEFAQCTYVRWRSLNNKVYHRLQNCPEPPTYGTMKNDLIRLAAHADGRMPAVPEGAAAQPTSTQKLQAATSGWADSGRIDVPSGAALTQWLEATLPLVDEANDREIARYKELHYKAAVASLRQALLTLLDQRKPIFVYFSQYFRVRPRIHLERLAERSEQNLLDDAEYDFGNLSLLKLLGFTARELSDLGKAAEPSKGDAAAWQRYQDQLDRRSYKLNAASVRLTNEIKKVWQPEASTSGGNQDAFAIRIVADQQYLKVVVVDDLGVEIELDQRSEGFQWLVSFFTVFFAQTADKYRKAILLLDEPGLSLHGLKQRDFRTTISRLAEQNQILFTTHSPFMVGPDELDRVRVVEMIDRKVGTKVHTSVTAEDPASVLVLQEALGYDLAQSLFAQQRNLVMEGLTDYWYVEATASLLRESGDADLNEKIALVPAGDAGKVVYFATIFHAHNLKVAALLDSDAAGDQAANQDTLVHTLGNKRILRTKDSYKGPVGKPETEDALRESLLAVGRDDLGWDVAAQAAQQSTRPIVDVFADKFGPGFSKYKLAKAYLRWTRNHTAGDLTADERSQWSKLIEQVNKALK